MKPGAQSSVERGLDPDTDSDDSDTNSVAVAEPGFSQFLMNFPYEEPPEEKGQFQPHGLMSFPFEETPEETKEHSRPHRILNFPHEKGMRGKIQSLAITNLPYEDEQRYQTFFYHFDYGFCARKL
jgi:hypothetical protein